MNTNAPKIPENILAKIIIDQCFKIHRRLGPGLLESTYKKILAHQLRKLGHQVVEEAPVPLLWDDEVVEEVAYRADLLVDDLVVVELKSTIEDKRVFHRQTFNAVFLLEKRLGLLINFGNCYLKDGLFRIVNGLPEEA